MSKPTTPELGDLGAKLSTIESKLSVALGVNKTLQEELGAVNREFREYESALIYGRQVRLLRVEVIAVERTPETEKLHKKLLKSLALGDVLALDLPQEG